MKDTKHEWNQKKILSCEFYRLNWIVENIMAAQKLRLIIHNSYSSCFSCPS